MPREVSRAERLLAMEALLLAHPDGLRQSDIAKRLGVHRSTVLRALPDLTVQFQVYEKPDGRLAIDRDAYLTRLRVTVHEATAIYLAARLLHRQSDEHNPHAISALFKLGAALRHVAPAMAQGIIDTADYMEREPGREAPGYISVLETLTRAWMAGRWVRIRYRRRGATAETETRLAPYLLEACGPGFATYVLGMREPPGEVRVLKIERIVTAELTHDAFEPPHDLDVARAFVGAWGVWLPVDGESVEVVLRFDPAVAGRVCESRWHPSEWRTTLPDGSVEWHAQVGEPTEILPWVLGWGGAVEVMAPPALRHAVAAEHVAAVRRYG